MISNHFLAIIVIVIDNHFFLTIFECPENNNGEFFRHSKSLKDVESLESVENVKSLEDYNVEAIMGYMNNSLFNIIQQLSDKIFDIFNFC